MTDRQQSWALFILWGCVLFVAALFYLHIAP